MLTFEIIKKYYEKEYYTVRQIKDFCSVGYITESQYTEITGKIYWESID